MTVCLLECTNQVAKSTTSRKFPTRAKTEQGSVCGYSATSTKNALDIVLNLNENHNSFKLKEKTYKNNYHKILVVHLGAYSFSSL